MEKTREEAAAEGAALKERGNICFKKGMYESAVDLYSQALQRDSSCAVYLTNRALCFKKLKRWKQVTEDCRAALLLDVNSVKAHYLLGDALLQLERLEEGLQHLVKARALADRSSLIGKEIEEALLKGKKLLYFSREEERSKERTELVSFLRHSLELLYTNGALSYAELQERLEQLDRLAAEAAESTAPFEVPSCLSCNISMAIMSDPVITPSGLTYERDLLLEHLRHNGAFDPITRKPCLPNSLVPNYALKDHISWFLEKYPWAYDR